MQNKLIILRMSGACRLISESSCIGRGLASEGGLGISVQ
jgi:hypothetical protein